MIDKHVIEACYCFLHQKQRVYQYSTLEWQKDDIEYAIENYADGMSKELYDAISCGRKDFLRTHVCFSDDMEKALHMLETMINSNTP